MPAIPAEVPLWLAIMLKKRRRCRIQQPDWLTEEELTRKLEEERREPSQFVNMPGNFVEVAQLLLDNARDDLQEAHRLQTLLADIENARHAKIRFGLRQLEESTTFIFMNHITPLEINRVRRFTSGALDVLRKMKPEGDEVMQTPPTTRPTPGQSQSQDPRTGDDDLQAALRRRR